MTDAEIETIIARVGEKKRPLDEVRDFSFARQAMKELEAGKYKDEVIKEKDKCTGIRVFILYPFAFILSSSAFD